MQRFIRNQFSKKDIKYSEIEHTETLCTTKFVEPMQFINAYLDGFAVFPDLRYSFDIVKI